MRPRLLSFLAFSSLVSGLVAAAPAIQLSRTPNDGIQPQAVVDREGAVHLIYYQGKSGAGDLFYVRQDSGAGEFSKPIPVNDQPGSAMAVGTIRGAQLAVGRNGRAHVAWNGHAPKDGDYFQAPMLYARMNDTRSGFEPARNLITTARGLDGGGSVAADDQGNVYVFWHAPQPGNTNGEAGRAVFLARSTDDGRHFNPEKLAVQKPTGACGCCGMKGFTDAQGNVYALYRAAREMVNRDEVLLVSKNRGADFEIAYAHPWKVASCPMSSAFLTESKRGVAATWETDGKVYWATVNPRTLKISEPVSPSQNTRCKHPVLATNAEGEVLLVWTEGTAWEKGGAVAWQLYDSSGQPTSVKGRADGVPVWSMAAAYPKSDGSFVIVY